MTASGCRTSDSLGRGGRPALAGYYSLGVKDSKEFQCKKQRIGATALDTNVWQGGSLTFSDLGLPSLLAILRLRLLVLRASRFYCLAFMRALTKRKASHPNHEHRPTPISPPVATKYADTRIFAARWCSEAQAPPLRSTVAFVLSAVFVSSPGTPSETWYPTPIEARAPPVAECADAGPRGLETQSCPGTGLLMTSDVTDGASVVSRLGAGAASRRTRKSRNREKVGVPSNARATGPVVPDRAWRWCAEDRAIGGELGP